MSHLLLKSARYARCYGDLVLGIPRTPEEAIDYCVDRPILMAQVRSEISQLARIVQAHAPTRSLEIGTNYGGTLLLLCRLSPPNAKIISVDLPSGAFGGGYPKRKIPLFRLFPRQAQKLYLIRADSHAAETKGRVLRILRGDKLDYLFIDGDHTYDGVRRDFETYMPLVRSGGIVAFHDIVDHTDRMSCQVDKFWIEIKRTYKHREIVEDAHQGWGGIGVLFIP